MTITRTLLAATAAVIVAALVPAAPALAQSDEAGCHDGALAQMPGFYINECEVGANDHFVFADGTRAQKDVSGAKLRIAYAIRDGVNPPTPTTVLRDYGAMLKAQGWTIVGSGDERWITARQGPAPTARWVEIATNGGGNYQIVYVTP